ncbi:glycosyltransferase [Nostoc sp. CENA543]|nr:glycosyltransferase [Nostoc sp. CENA543]
MRLYNWHSTMTSRWFHPLVLLLWFIIGLGLRLTNLTAKPPWTDEFSTLVFSLGNSFLGVPLDQAIAPEILLQPLQPQAAASLNDVWKHLSHETNHPPIYFALSHLWMQLFPTQQGLVSLWGARSLAAILGAISIPAMYIFGWIVFRSRIVAHLAAAMMAVSPYAIFLAQEARHYTLAILWVIASLTCFVITTRHIQNQTQLPIPLALSWVIINALGIATHYFFVLTLCTEGLVLIVLAGRKIHNSPKIFPKVFLSPPWRRIYAVILGTFITGIVWLPVFLQNSYGDKLTDWIQQPRVGFAWISPFFQAFAAWVTMLYLLPVESPQLWIVIASGLVMLIFIIWAAPIFVRGLKVQLQTPETQLETRVLMGLVIGAIALFFVFTYFLGIDLTRGARYNFVYFPAVIVLLGANLAVIWQNFQQKKAVILIWLMGFLSAITVICNLGYQKYYRPDLFVSLIQQTSQVPVLIATTQITHVQIGEMMGIAREFRIKNVTNPTPLFLLAHQDKDINTATKTLENTLNQLPPSFDLWLVNFHAPVDEAVKNCTANSQPLPAINGYESKVYHCKTSANLDFEF